MTINQDSQRMMAPREDVESAEFWAAARQGRLLIRYCETCARPHWYPRALCPFCMGTTQWRDASGRGTVYSFSITRAGGLAAYCMAYVALDEGVTMMTRIVGCDFDKIRIGQTVQVNFSETEGGAPVPTFTPLD